VELDRAGSIMSQRAHFWLRIVGLAVIFAAEIGPRLWSTDAHAEPQSSMASVEHALAR
jgi:hypothetical protein